MAVIIVVCVCMAGHRCIVRHQVTT